MIGQSLQMYQAIKIQMREETETNTNQTLAMWLLSTVRPVHEDHIH